MKRSSTRSCEVAIQRSKTKPGERLPYLLSKLKAPRVLERLEQTAVLAREQDWPFERFLETLLPRSRSCVPRPARRDRGVCERVHRVAFATAQEWVSPLGQAHDCNQLEQELRRLERYHLLVADEVGYLPFRQAANLLFALVSRRYERGSIIVTSNRGFEQCGEILGDAMVAAA